MIDVIFKRRPIRDFLKNYPAEKWKEVIPDVFEIGVLNLKNSFNKTNFTKKEFENILSELRSYNSNNNNNYTIKNNPQEEFSDEYFSSFENDSSYNNYTIEEQKINNNKNKPSNCEVFIPDMKEIKRNIKKNWPRKEYYINQNEIREQNKENNRNLYYTESKIRAQIINDKMIHNAMKRGENIEKYKINDKYIKNNGTNYAISYDKNLRPENTQIKEKDNKNFNYTNTYNNYSNYNNSNFNSGYENNFSNNEINDDLNNYQDYNNENNNTENNLNYNYNDNEMEQKK
jgi:hypothetical protein